MPDQKVAILVYHHVYEDQLMSTLDPAPGIIGRTEFTRQMNHIAEIGWSVVSTSNVVDWLIDDAPLPDPAVAIHFDNGWLDTYTIALPILKQLGFTATCFPITDGLEAATQGKTKSVRTLTEGVVEHPFMTWPQAQELLDAGWEIGAHTATHCKTAQTHASDGDQGVLLEANSSNEIFKKRLGFSPAHFAYPSGSRNRKTDELLAPIYRSLRLWHDPSPIIWTFTDKNTSHLAIDCQNIDVRIPFDDYKRIFTEALQA